LELVGLGIGRTGHARELVVEAEVVLEGDRGQRLVLGLDGHAFFCLDGLVKAIAPAPARHQTAGELIDDDDLTVLVHIVLIAVVQVMRLQRGDEVVQQRNVGGVVQRCALGQQTGLREQALGVLVALFGEVNLVRFLIHREVAGLDDALARAHVGFAFLASEVRHQAVDGDVHRRLVVGLAADDQGRAGFVDKDGVHLVHDGEVQSALHTIHCLIDHVVTEVVEAVFVVGAVGDVGTIGGLLFFARRLRQVDAHREPQEVVEAAHPLGVATGQVVVHGDHVHALARQGVQVHRQGSGQRLALARAHFGHFAVVQRDAAEHLHVEVAHLHDALAGFAHHSKGFDQQIVERGTIGNAALELVGLGAQIGVAEALQRGLQGVDALHRLAVLLEQAVVAAAEKLGQKLNGHTVETGRTPQGFRSDGREVKRRWAPRPGYQTGEWHR